jgi:F-type H+-transporting ATPase subunit delta
MGTQLTAHQQSVYKSQDVVQVNIPAESGEMGVLANHVPSIEQLKPGLVEVIEESGGSKQFFRTFRPADGIDS